MNMKTRPLGAPDPYISGKCMQRQLQAHAARYMYQDADTDHVEACAQMHSMSGVWPETHMIHGQSGG